MAIIEYDIIGFSNFLRDAVYRSLLPNFIKEFENKFLLAENVIIQFEESINPNPNNSVRSEPTVSDDGKRIELVYTTRRFFNSKGGTSKPSKDEFFRGLSYYLDNTVIAGDHERFEKLKSTQ